MKVNFSLVFLGAVAASAIALPAQAAVLTTTTNVGGTVSPAAAYQVTNLTVGSNTYTIDFDHGIFAPTPTGVTDNRLTSVYNGVFPTLPGGTALTATSAKAIGDAIVAALNAAGVSTVIEKTSNTPTYGPDVKTQFYIPFGLNPNVGQASDNLVAFCTIPSGCDTSQFQNVTGPVMYAKFTPVPGNNIPTPALIPGLLGMGLAAMRKKQQAA